MFGPLRSNQHCTGVLVEQFPLQHLVVVQLHVGGGGGWQELAGHGLVNVPGSSQSGPKAVQVRTQAPVESSLHRVQ